MNPNPPSNPGFPGPDPSNPHEQTQLSPTWQGGDATQVGAPSYPQYPNQQPYPDPNQQVYAVGAPMPQFAPPAPKKPRPGWLIPALIGGVAVVVILAVIAGIMLFSSSDDDSSTPGGTVKAYFAALQAGDAKKALSYGKESPASTELLTDEVLRKQRDLAPIKDLKIVSESDGYMGTVHLTVSIGEVAYDEELSLEKVGDEWKLGAAAVQIKPYFSYDSDKKNITILGKPLPASGVIYVFPGALDLGSTSKNLVARSSSYSARDDKGQASVKGLSRYGSSSSLSVEFGLSEAAKTSVREQLSAKFAACAASKDGYPTGCPQSDFSGEKGTYTWTAPNVADIDLSEQVRDGQLRLSQSQTWNFTATGRDGRPITGSDSAYVSSTVTVTGDAVAVSSR